MKTDTQKDVSPKKYKEDIIKNVKEAALTSYGVKAISTVLSKKGETDWIEVDVEKDKTFSLNLHIVVAQKVKITEVLRSCQKTVRFYMNHLYPNLCTSINVYAEGII